MLTRGPGLPWMSGRRSIQRCSSMTFFALHGLSGNHFLTCPYINTGIEEFTTIFQKLLLAVCICFWTFIGTSYDLFFFQNIFEIQVQWFNPWRHLENDIHVSFNIKKKGEEIWRSRMTNNPKQQGIQVKKMQRNYKNIRLHDDYGPTLDGKLERQQSSNRCG